MPYKIEGSISGEARVIVLNDSYQVEASELVSGNYTIDTLTSGTKIILAQDGSGETLGYSSVSPVSYSSEITIPHEQDWGHMSNGEFFTDTNDWEIWPPPPADDILPAPYYDSNFVSWNTNFTGGLVMNTSIKNGINSVFRMKGDFEIDFHVSETSVNHSGAGGMYISVQNDSGRDKAQWTFFEDSGHQTWAQYINNTVAGTSLQLNTTDYDPVFKIKREGNVFRMYINNTLMQSMTLNYIWPFCLIRVSCDEWGTKNQNMVLHSIDILEGTTAYPTTYGVTGNTMDSSVWTVTNGNVEAENGRIKMIGGASESNSVKLNHPLTGDFSLKTSFEITNHPNSNAWYYSLTIGPEDGSKFIYFQRRWASGADKLALSYYDGSNYHYLWDGPNYNDNTGDVYAARDGDTIRMWLHTVGTGWQRGYAPIDLSGDVRVKYSLTTRDNFPNTIGYWDTLTIYE